MRRKAKKITGWRPIQQGLFGRFRASREGPPYLGDVVHARAPLKSTGVVVGVRRCQLEGCGHTQLGVRWSKTRLTWPCTGAMLPVLQKGKRHWRIL